MTEVSMIEVNTIKNPPKNCQLKPKLWHCYNSRSLRALWALEELAVDYDIEVMTFPPRYYQAGYKDQVNSLGTVPYFVDGEVHLTESAAICHFLGEKSLTEQNNQALALSFNDPDYGNYLNWLYHSDATLTFPQTLVLRYKAFATKDCTQQQTAEDYEQWFAARLIRLHEHLQHHEYLCANRFTMADIAIGYALHLGTLLKLDRHYSPEIKAYLSRLRARPAFKRAQAIGQEKDPFKG